MSRQCEQRSLKIRPESVGNLAPHDECGSAMIASRGPTAVNDGLVDKERSVQSHQLQDSLKGSM
jgi:hypothetical protein